MNPMDEIRMKAAIQAQSSGREFQEDLGRAFRPATTQAWPMGGLVAAVRTDSNPGSIENQQQQLIENMSDLCVVLSAALDKLHGSRPSLDSIEANKEHQPNIGTRFGKLHRLMEVALADARSIQGAL
jgi:hypothetical protein